MMVPPNPHAYPVCWLAVQPTAIPFLARDHACLAMLGPANASCYDATMSLERSSHLPGGFQIRHRTLGIYQGSAIELAFWHPSSAMPEYGLCRFSSEEKAQAFVAFLCSPACTEPMDSADLSIEPYDLIEHERLISEHPLSSAWETPL